MRALEALGMGGDYPRAYSHTPEYWCNQPSHTQSLALSSSLSLCCEKRFKLRSYDVRLKREGAETVGRERSG